MLASEPILGTKLYIPPPPPKVVVRSRLIERLDEGLSAGQKLTLISTPAGSGTTTLSTNELPAASDGSPELQGCSISNTGITKPMSLQSTRRQNIVN